MSIRARFLLIAAALIVLLSGIFYVMMLVRQNELALAESEARHYVSYKLADELRQSSDDLTRMARTYVVTGDLRYEEYFRPILAIRNGEAPRPENYQGVYWDRVTAQHREPEATGETIALEELMRQMEFAPEEFAKLREAQANSDALVALEDRAMAAVKGLFPDESGAYTVRGEPDMELARELLHGDSYHREKGRIMEPIAAFLGMVEERTEAELYAAQERGQLLNLIALGLMALALGLVAVIFVTLQRRVAHPVVALAEAAQRVETGDYGRRVDVDSADEVGTLARAFNQMSAAIERDVAEREQTAAELAEARESADQANRAKSAFLANMSHELRTPMNAVIGYSEMLVEEMEEQNLEEFVPDLYKIHTAGKHLLSLINDVLDLSKIEAGRMDIYLEHFDLREMLDEAVATVTPLADQNANTLVTDFDDGLGAMQADLTKVRQSLFNLLSNAAKLANQGTITLGAHREPTDSGDQITLSVSDTGIGFPPEKLAHIFEEFSQAAASTTRNFGGTGLGLAISKRFCQMMEGDISVTSAPR
jgi:signal transduction histidine kinase